MFHPYHVEPYADGNSLHVIGFVPEIDDIRTFKFEMIVRIDLLKDTYSIPVDFNIDIYLKDFLGITQNTQRALLQKLVVECVATAKCIETKHSEAGITFTLYIVVWRDTCTF